MKMILKYEVDTEIREDEKQGILNDIMNKLGFIFENYFTNKNKVKLRKYDGCCVLFDVESSHFWLDFYDLLRELSSIIIGIYKFEPFEIEIKEYGE